MSEFCRLRCGCGVEGQLGSKEDSKASKDGTSGVSYLGHDLHRWPGTPTGYALSPRRCIGLRTSLTAVTSGMLEGGLRTKDSCVPRLVWQGTSSSTDRLLRFIFFLVSPKVSLHDSSATGKQTRYDDPAIGIM
jgi:hypothetical protein